MLYAMDSYQITYSLVEFVDSSPKLIDNMAVEANEENERDDEDDDGDSTEVELPPQCWPVCEVTDTFWLLDAALSRIS